MSALTDALGSHAAPVTFDHDGVTYEVTPITQAVKTKIERWLRKLVYADLYTSRQDMPPEQYEHALSLLSQHRSRFAYLGPLYWETVGTLDGLTGLVAILFQTTEKDAAKLLDQRGPDVDALVSETTLASMPRAQAEIYHQRIEQIKAKQREEGEAGTGLDPTSPPA